MTDRATPQCTRNCAFCGAVFSRSDPNWRKKTYCGKSCYQAAEHAKGPARFWAKVDKGPHQKGCWLYTGFLKWDGYGWLHRKVNGKNRYLTAHRYAWILAHGVPAEGAHILHNCDVAACCNPDHLRLGTHAENMNDMTVRERRKTKLTTAQVREIKRELRENQGKYGFQTELAQRYGVADTCISAIKLGDHWKHVK